MGPMSTRPIPVRDPSGMQLKRSYRGYQNQLSGLVPCRLHHIKGEGPDSDRSDIDSSGLLHPHLYRSREAQQRREHQPTLHQSQGRDRRGSRGPLGRLLCPQPPCFTPATSRRRWHLQESLMMISTLSLDVNYMF
jgi:hypothetical protein